jgi:hypothetical protein
MPTQNKLLSIYSDSMMPFLNFILKDISDKFDIDYETLQNHYIGHIKVKKKRNINKKGTMTSYAIYLKDSNIMNQIKTRYPDLSFGEYSKIKGEIWRTLSDVDKNIYKQKAIEYNNQLKLKNIKENITNEEIIENEKI